MTTQRKIALVTGASKGIGAAIALELARSGYDIWLNYRNDTAAAEAIRQQVDGCGCNCILLPFDVADLAATEAALQPLLDNHTPFAVINNAGYARDTLLAMMGEKEWHDVLDVHLGGFFNVTRTVLPKMMRKRQGRIVNMVSTSGQIGVAGQSNYSAAKAGLIGATRSLAMEIAQRNILVNAVAPGFIETDMIADLPKEHILPLIPLKRVGDVEDIAYMVDYLCSAKAKYITGQVFSVNGGSCMV